MKHDLAIKHGIIIPEHELEITASRAGGPGGQHVNKTSSRISVRWNVPRSTALREDQKERLLQKLHSRLTLDGDLIIHSSASRSQEQNKKAALLQLAETISKALHVPKKRMATRVPRGVKASRLDSKTHLGKIKKLRSQAHHDE